MVNLPKRIGVLIFCGFVGLRLFAGGTQAVESQGEWVKVMNLKVGDLLFTEDGWQEIEAIEYFQSEEPFQVYNLSVDWPNTFWAGGILAHNKGDPILGCDVRDCTDFMGKDYCDKDENLFCYQDHNRPYEGDWVCRNVACPEDPDCVCATPTPTPVANVAPTCSNLSVASPIVRGSSVAITATAADSDGYVNYVSFHSVPVGVDYCAGGSWTTIGTDNHDADSGTWTVNWGTSGVVPGSYYLVANVFDDDGSWCTGNPSGSCGLDVSVCGSCRKQVVVVTPTPTRTPTPTPYCVDDSLIFSPNALEMVQMQNNQPLYIIGVDIMNDGEFDEGAVERVEFTSLNPDIVSVSPAVDTDTDDSFMTFLEAHEIIGTATIQAKVYLQTGQDCTGTVEVGVGGLPAWFQTEEGDVHAGISLTDSIPEWLGTYCSLDTNPYASLYPGVVFHGGSTNLVNDVDGINNTSTEGWLVDITGSPFAKESFNYFYELLGRPADSGITGEIDISTLGDGEMIYVSNDAGNTTLRGSLQSNRSAVIITRGSIGITSNLIIQNDSGSSLVVIAEDGIWVQHTVTSMAGIFITDGDFDSSHGITGNSTLRVNGTVIADNVDLNRDLGDENFNSPAEEFYFRADLWVNSPQELWASKGRFEELAP